MKKSIKKEKRAKDKRDRIEEIISDGYKVYRFENNYKTLYKLLNIIDDNGLPKNIIHDFILATIETVINDVLELNCKMDKLMADVFNLKEEEKIEKKLKLRLENVNHLSLLTEKCLDKLLEICINNDDIKYAIRVEIPALYESNYYWISGEDELKDFIFESIVDNYELNKMNKIKLINDSVNVFIEDAEEFIDFKDVEKSSLNEFYKVRAKNAKESLKLKKR